MKNEDECKVVYIKDFLEKKSDLGGGARLYYTEKNQASKNIKIADIIESLSHDIEYHVSCLRSLKLDIDKIDTISMSLDEVVTMVHELATPV